MSRRLHQLVPHPAPQERRQADAAGSLDKIRRLGPLSEPFDGVYNRLKPAQVRIGAPSLSPSPSPSPSPISSA